MQEELREHTTRPYSPVPAKVPLPWIFGGLGASCDGTATTKQSGRSYRSMLCGSASRPRQQQTVSPKGQVASRLRGAATQEHNPPTWRTSSKPTQAKHNHTGAQLAESRAHLLRHKAVHTRAAREGNEKFLKEASIDTPPPRQYPSSQPL